MASQEFVGTSPEFYSTSAEIITILAVALFFEVRVFRPQRAPASTAGLIGFAVTFAFIAVGVGRCLYVLGPGAPSEADPSLVYYVIVIELFVIGLGTIYWLQRKESERDLRESRREQQEVLQKMQASEGASERLRQSSEELQGLVDELRRRQSDRDSDE